MLEIRSKFENWWRRRVRFANIFDKLSELRGKILSQNFKLAVELVKQSKYLYRTANTEELGSIHLFDWIRSDKANYVKQIPTHTTQSDKKISAGEVEIK